MTERERRSSRRDGKGRKKKHESDASDQSIEPRRKSSSRKDREHENDRRERKRLRKEKRKDKERKRNKEKLDESSSGSELDVVLKPEDVVAEIYSNFPNEAKDLGQVYFQLCIELVLFSYSNTT